MKKMFEKVKGSGLITAILSILYGVVLIVWHDFVQDTVCIAVGSAIILVGIFFVIQYIRKDVLRDFYKRELVWGLSAVAFGVLIIVKNEQIQNFFPMLFGAIVLLSGFVKLQNALDLFRIKENTWGFILGLAVLNIAVGIIIVLNPSWILNFTFILIGAALLYSGISDIVTIILFANGAKKKQGEIKDNDIID